MDETLDKTAAVWEAQAQADPLWAVLSEPDKLGRGWDVASFMATGEEQIAKTLAKFAELGGRLPDHRTAVDFGSGVGRLSQALAERFDDVTGVDISPTMVAVARRLNRHGDRVRYLLNERPDLSLLADGSATLVLTHITLQHVPPDAARSYINEFLRVVRPGGAIIFQMPSHFSDSYLPFDSDDQPIAPSDRRAAIEILSVPTSIVAGESFEIGVRVWNLSLVDWIQSAAHPIRVGNHWMEPESGHTLVYDDGRTRLPGRVRAGRCVDATIRAHAPVRPGRYELGVDVVQEVISWFADLGGVITTAMVDVSTPAPAGDSNVAVTSSYDDSTFDDLISPLFSEAPMFEMNAIHRDEIEQIITDHGATLLGTEEWVTEWHSFTYYIQAGS